MAKGWPRHDLRAQSSAFDGLPCTTDRYAGLPILPLRDVLARLPLPPSCSLLGVSNKWRCVLVPRVSVTNGTSKTAHSSHSSSSSTKHSTFDASLCAEDGNDSTSSGGTCTAPVCRCCAERDALAYLQSGLPVLLDSTYAAPVHTREKSDGVEFVTNPQWNCFARPQIALRTGWGAPGVPHDTSHYHKLVRSFKEVFEHTAGVPVDVSEAEVRSYEQQNSSSRDKKHDEQEQQHHEEARPQRRSDCAEGASVLSTSFSAGVKTCHPTNDTPTYVSSRLEDADACDMAEQSSTCVHGDGIDAVTDAAAEILELQYFHRDTAAPARTTYTDAHHRRDASNSNYTDTASGAARSLPALGEYLCWPAFLDERVGGIVTEVATCVAQRGALRHWHLNDSGEFVLQTALTCRDATPLTATTVPNSSRQESFTSAYERYIDSQLFGPDWAQHGVCESNEEDSSSHNTCTGNADSRDSTHDHYNITDTDSHKSRQSRRKQYSHRRGKPIRLYLYAARASYDWFIHDDEATLTGHVVGLDIFHAPDETLPDEASVLPVLAVAVVMSGGSPLLSPPNLPQLTIQLHDGVVVEQRRLSNLWLDEVSYFLHRCAHWSSDAMLYSYLERELQDEHYVAGLLIPQLIHLFTTLSTEAKEDGLTDMDGAGGAEHAVFHADVTAALRHRVVCSLLAIAYHEKHYALLPSSRASLLQLVRYGGRADMHHVAQLIPQCGLPCAFAAPPPYSAEPLSLSSPRAEAEVVCTDASDRAVAPKQSVDACAPKHVGGECTRSECILQNYWDIRRCWPRAGCVLYTVSPSKDIHCLLQKHASAEHRRYSKQTDSLAQSTCCCIASSSAALDAPRQAGDVGAYVSCFVPVVYVDSRPVFGCVAPTLSATVEEYHSMRLLSEAGKVRELHAFLRSRKAQEDEMLNELF